MRVMSPPTHNSTEISTRGGDAQQMFYRRSQDSNPMWNVKNQRDSSNITDSNYGVKPMFGFGRAPGTAGRPFGSIDQSSQEGMFA